MAIRQIRMAGDPILSKTCKEVKEMTPLLKTLAEDMLDTMYEANGVGLAAPQVGILKRMVVVDIGEEGDGPLIMVNPQIVEEEGEQVGDEGCLSLPGKAGQVTRPNRIVVKFYNENMEKTQLGAKELLARAICHEVDHLDGHMYMELVVGGIHDAQYEDE